MKKLKNKWRVIRDKIPYINRGEKNLDDLSVRELMKQMEGSDNLNVIQNNKLSLVRILVCVLALSNFIDHLN